MSETTISLRSDLVERLQTLAQEQGRTVDEVFDELLEQYPRKSSSDNWAFEVAQAMEDADIDWLDEPDLSARSRENFKQSVHKR